MSMDNSDWWAAELDVPTELCAIEFVFVDPASNIVDNNKYAAAQLPATRSRHDFLESVSIDVL